MTTQERAAAAWADLNDRQRTYMAQELRPNRSGTRFLGLRIDAGLVQRELAALTGRPTGSTVRFDLPLDLSEPRGRAVKLLIGH
ncbi:hypothetical protein [Nonomuraea sp. bgisy101]|uniref:hypothetical protein n=1 Tax=Nonomuraea sp. bgisy101 TaxID=3413784 RepID=UPI003D70D570